MLQLVQKQKDGSLQVVEMPLPQCPYNGILVKTEYSLISAGTEKTSVENAKGSLIDRARKQPEQVKQVLEALKTYGLASTIRRVQNTLNSFKVLGYSAAGVVLESKSKNFRVGDRVAVGGAGKANHAGVLAIPQNLAVKIPDNVNTRQAAYATVGSIAMQGIRLAKPELGEVVVVVGLGLIGLLAVQMLKANGCIVIGIDINENTFELAKKCGANYVSKPGAEALAVVNSLSSFNGADSVIITAGSSSSQPLNQAMELVRKRGKVVIVGAVGMNLNRHPFYQKEVELSISCSYGPGRYDANYEEYGIDYPYQYVRWTENRNLQSVIDLISRKLLDVDILTTHEFDLDTAPEAYKLLTGEKKESYLGIVLKYNEKSWQSIKSSSSNFPKLDSLKIGFIGLGQFAQNYILPTISKSQSVLYGIAGNTPSNVKAASEINGFKKIFEKTDDLLKSNEIDSVFVASRHDSHAKYVISALENGKSVFVEKPLCINQVELDQIKILADSGGRVMTGFNRRFSEPFQRIQEFFQEIASPKVMLYRVNAGFIPPNHWVQHENQGGRIIGEVCHFIDTLISLANSLPVSVFASGTNGNSGGYNPHDNISITITFANGSVGTILYIADGDKSVPKEYCEVFAGGKSAIMKNFEMVDFHLGNKINSKKFSGDKGIETEIKETINSMKNGSPMPIPFEQIYAVTKTTFLINKSLQDGKVHNLEI